MARFLLKNMTDSQYESIIQTYISGKTTYETADDFGISQGLVVKILKRFNINARKAYDYYVNNKLNYNFFDKIDTEPKAYFLGLLFADGCNYRAKHDNNSSFYIVSINLQERDKAILECFRSYIAPGYSLRYLDKKKYSSTNSNQYDLQFSDKTISDQLVNLGMVPAKSLILQYPTQHISKELEHHFIRGYFDGDGCITSYIPKKCKSPQYRFSISATLEFCQSINAILQTNFGFSLGISRQSKIHDGKIGGNQQVYRLMSWLYHDATIYLKRKHEKYLDLQREIARYV